MAGLKVFMCIVSVFLHVATPWTVDLPEVRKQHFKHGPESDKSIYDNIENNSKLTDENVAPYDIYRDKYANEYEYLGYREKEINNDNIQKGNQYLEGLRKSIDQYSRILDYCQRFNGTLENERLKTGDENTKSDTDDRTRETCDRATQSREHVRRLAELAVHTTNQLQDLEFEERFRKKDEGREKELLMKLAFFLDELAHHTGFVPAPAPAETSTETTTEVPTTAAPFLDLGFLQLPEDVRARMLSCLRANGSEPAIDRCAFPLPLPPFVRRLLSNTDSSANDSAPNSAVPEQSISQSREPATANTSPEAAVTTVKFDSFAQRRKRSIDDDPLQNVLQYYLKYHTWLNSNLKPIPNDKTADKLDFNVGNDLKKTIIKRSINKQSSMEDPFQILHSPSNSARKLTDNEMKNQQEKINNYLEKLRNSNGLIAKKHSKKIFKDLKSIHKRSIRYENPIRPRIAQDPYQDISKYVKSRPGRNYSPDLNQAVQVRGNLETSFQNGNLEVIRRYGSNVNPLVPLPFYAGIIATVSDI